MYHRVTYLNPIAVGFFLMSLPLKKAPAPTPAALGKGFFSSFHHSYSAKGAAFCTVEASKELNLSCRFLYRSIPFPVFSQDVHPPTHRSTESRIIYASFSPCLTDPPRTAEFMNNMGRRHFLQRANCSPGNLAALNGLVM